MPNSSYAHGFPNGLVVQENPIVVSPGGKTFWVDSGDGSNGPGQFGKGTFKHAFATLDYAISKVKQTGNNGDVIRIKAGHAETLTSAGAIAIDIAGITAIGEGYGADRPTFTFSSTDNSASVLITAANFSWFNCIGICGDDGLTNPIHVQAANCTIDPATGNPTTQSRPMSWSSLKY